MKNILATIKERLISLVIVFAAAIVPAGAMAQATARTAPEIGNIANTRLEGTWQTVVTFEDDFELKVLFTFMPGRDESEGTLIDQNEFLLTPNPVCTADQGVWKQTSTRAYIATHFAFCFDADKGYEPVGSVKVRDEIELNLKGTAFTGRQYIEILDLEGKVVDVFEADMAGTRVIAQAPPAAAPGRAVSRQGTLFQKHFRFMGRASNK